MSMKRVPSNFVCTTSLEGLAFNFLMCLFIVTLACSHFHLCDAQVCLLLVAISTRPFLTVIEKKWIAFQLLKALEECHSKRVRERHV